MLFERGVAAVVAALAAAAVAAHLNSPFPAADNEPGRDSSPPRPTFVDGRMRFVGGAGASQNRCGPVSKQPRAAPGARIGPIQRRGVPTPSHPRAGGSAPQPSFEDKDEDMFNRTLTALAAAAI